MLCQHFINETKQEISKISTTKSPKKSTSKLWARIGILGTKRGKYDLYLVRNFIKCQLQPKKCKKVSKYTFREPKYKPAFYGLHEKITFFRLHFKGIKR